MHPAWELAIETGGTFTDALGIAPSGEVHRAKVLSSGCVRVTLRGTAEGQWLTLEGGCELAGLATGAMVRELGGRVLGTIAAERRLGDTWQVRLGGAGAEVAPPPAALGRVLEIDFGEDAPVLAARVLTRTPRGEPLPRCGLRLATTRATNALLTRAMAPCAIVLTAGFGDLLEIGTQARPEIFALRIDRPPPIPAWTIECPGRLDATGTEIEPLDTATVAAHAARLVRDGCRSFAVALLHADVNPAHERAVAQALRAAGAEHVSLSSEACPEIGLLRRARTVAVNAALAPVIGAYLDAVGRAMTGADPQQATPGQTTPAAHVLTSAGGLSRITTIRPKDMLFSGPAGGVMGAVAAAARSGVHRVITFDMGGTSTDVARCEADDRAMPRIEYVFEHRVADAQISAPAVAVESVAAGGGSICGFDPASGLTVGPRSAGAVPGPACYGAGGPLTVTDCNLLLGRLAPDQFAIPIHPAPARAAADALAAMVNAARRQREPELTVTNVLERLLDLADETMAAAIRTISVQRGFDPCPLTLVAFGGAGGQHACGVAEALGMSHILIPADVGLLSARGLLAAEFEGLAHRQLLRTLDDDAPWLHDAVEQVSREAVERARSEAGGSAPAGDEGSRRGGACRVLLEIRREGMDAALTVPVPEGPWHAADLRAAFNERFSAEFGHRPGDRPLEVVALRAVATIAGREAVPTTATSNRSTTATDPPPATTALGPVRRRSAIAHGESVRGPMIVSEAHGCTVIRDGWEGAPDEHGALHLRRMVVATGGRTRAISPPAFELLAARIAGLATDMGETLRRVALSTNVKERLDFSCAVLDREGELIVNAPHLPVHLGALGVTVRAVCTALELRPGDVAVTNHPAFGGSHLPDVTVITPVHTTGGELVGYVANRAHHAEIGGIRPGSMPPSARSLAEEGVVIPPMHLVRAGVDAFADVDNLLRSGPHPSRRPAENLADLAAQVAANRRGGQGLLALQALAGGALTASMAALKDRAEALLAQALAAREGATLHAAESLDDGSPITVAIIIRDGRVKVDFSGSAPVHRGNFNAPAGVVRSAVMYVLRTMLVDAVPLNEGLMRRVELVIPSGMLNPPFAPDPDRCPPVCAGNVETSQRVVDVLIKALGLAAASQGTMNNVIFGDATFGYYETVCGGSGAGLGYAGTSAVHTHMTNTRITDAEVLERRYPVRLRRFGLRRGSGGPGAFAGGDGAIREYEFLRAVELSLLTQRRASGPFG
ncbi:MAG: hydantoinase B/oxoprolinase family protein, partial [Phycisphaerales bacterium]